MLDLAGSLYRLARFCVAVEACLQAVGSDCTLQDILGEQVRFVVPTHLDTNCVQGQRQKSQTRKEDRVDQHDDLRHTEAICITFQQIKGYTWIPAEPAKALQRQLSRKEQAAHSPLLQQTLPDT